MLQAHCILYYRSGRRTEYRADTMREVETFMEQAGRAARKRGDEITHHAVGICQADTPSKKRLQLPIAPFGE